MIIKGVQIILYDETVTGQDDFNRDIVTETAVKIDNVVIGKPTTDDINTEINLSGKQGCRVLWPEMADCWCTGTIYGWFHGKQVSLE